MANKAKMTLTSVKVQSNLFDDFKVECVRRKFSFQKLADRSIFCILQTKILGKKSTIKLISNYKH